MTQKNWKILRKIRSSPDGATTLIQAVNILILANPRLSFHEDLRDAGHDANEGG